MLRKWTRLPVFLLANYRARVLRLRPAAYWPLDEASGATAYDRAGSGLNGTYSNVTLGQAGIGDGRTAALYNGSTSFTNLYSAGLSALMGNEGSLGLWLKLSNVSGWTDGIVRMGVRLYADINNRLQIYKKDTSNQVELDQIAGGIYRSYVFTGANAFGDGWFHLGFTWSAAGGSVRYYVNGVRRSTNGAPGVWVGGLNSTFTIAGAGSTTPTFQWSGRLAHLVYFTRALTPAEMGLLGRK